ncbi:MAG: tyrosine-type recombinase/integrase [Halioglobus sp.]
MGLTPKRIKFTQQRLADLPIPPKGDYTVKDEGHPDLSCRVQASGAKSLQIFKRPKGHPNQCRIYIGKAGEIPLTEAYGLADAYAAELRKGVNPNERIRRERIRVDAEKRAAQQRSTTLEAALDNYLADTPNLKQATIDNYKRSVNIHLVDWKTRELADIAREEIKARHREISKKFPVQANKVLDHLRLLWNYTSEEATLNGALFPNWPLANRRDRRTVRNKEVRRSSYIPPGRMGDWYGAVTTLPDVQKRGDAELARDYLLFLLLTGCRRREATAITARQVDLRGRILTVADTKSGEPLALPINSFLAEVLERRLAVTRKRDGLLLPLDDPRRFIEIVREQSGIYFSSHCLRRTLITVAESLDISGYAIKALVNHTTAGNDVTAGYMNIGVERLRAPSQLIADTIARQAGIAPNNVAPIAIGKASEVD